MSIAWCALKVEVSPLVLTHQFHQHFLPTIITYAKGINLGEPDCKIQ